MFIYMRQIEVDIYCEDCGRYSVGILSGLGHWFCAICGALVMTLRKAA